MNPLELQLKALIKFLSDQKIKYVILGGVAVAVYGEPRLTADIDVNVILDKTKIDDFLRKSKNYGFFSRFSNTKKIAQKTGIIPLKFIRGKTLGICDVIMAENILEYAAIRRGRVKKIGKVKARFVSPEDLIIHKMASQRPRDIEDAKSILIRQKSRLDLKYILGWFKKIDEVDKQAGLSKFFKRLLSRKK